MYIKTVFIHTSRLIEIMDTMKRYYLEISWYIVNYFVLPPCVPLSVTCLWSKDNKTMNGQGIMQVILLLHVKHSGMTAMRTMK